MFMICVLIMYILILSYFNLNNVFNFICDLYIYSFIVYMKGWLFLNINIIVMKII